VELENLTVYGEQLIELWVSIVAIAGWEVYVPIGFRMAMKEIHLFGISKRETDAVQS